MLKGISQALSQGNAPKTSTSPPRSPPPPPPHPIVDEMKYSNRAEDQPQNVMIAQISKAMFPELLERRTRETEAERDRFDLCLPAFFYNVPVFPGQTLCLHFFEPRYKLMMRRIINTSRRCLRALLLLTC